MTPKKAFERLLQIRTDLRNLAREVQPEPWGYLACRPMDRADEMLQDVELGIALYGDRMGVKE